MLKKNYDFRNSGVEYLNFHNFHNYGMDFYEFHNFHNSCMNNLIFMMVLIFASHDFHYVSL